MTGIVESAFGLIIEEMMVFQKVAEVGVIHVETRVDSRTQFGRAWDLMFKIVLLECYFVLNGHILERVFFLR